MLVLTDSFYKLYKLLGKHAALVFLVEKFIRALYFYFFYKFQKIIIVFRIFHIYLTNGNIL